MSSRKPFSMRLSQVNHTLSQDEMKNFRDEKCQTLRMKTFFEYVKTAFQLNDSGDKPVNVVAIDDKIDWTNLMKIDVNNKLHTHRDEIRRKSMGNTDLTGNSTITGILDAVVPEITDIYTNEKTHADAFIMTDSYSFLQKSSTTNSDVTNSVSNIEINFSKKEEKTQNYSTDKIVHTSSSKISAYQFQINDLSELKNQDSNSEKGSMLKEMLKNHLSDILHEGLLDSVVPYMLPKPTLSQPVIKKTTSHTYAKKSLTAGRIIENCTSTDVIDTAENSKDKCRLSKKTFDNEVEIHVCDEAKNIKKDFHCPQKLLVQKMCYFANVTSGQKLEEIDISVHCDVLIFDWLMRWVKKDIIEKTERPVLETSNVIPIMVSASFLQMEPLLEHCLQYCHKNMCDILKTSTVLSRLNDDLLTRLADLFSNDDVEALKDKKDKIQSRLFCKLIMSLSNPVPENKKGHYSSLASLFKCAKCKKIVIRSISEAVPCVPSTMKIDKKGNVRSRHTRDNTWNLSEYIITLKSELRTWRKVYWKLWGDCHFFFCEECKMYFPLGQIDWCCYHPEIPQFFVNEEQRPMPFPLGRYPCCSQRAYRFQLLQNNEGCKYKEHLPFVGTDKDINMLNIFNAYREIISTEPPQLFFPEKITRLIASDSSFRSDKLVCKETMWWNGLVLVPPRPNLGLLGKIWGRSAYSRSIESRDSQKLSQKIYHSNVLRTNDSPGNSSDVNTDDENVETEDNASSTAEESYHSEESNAWSNFPVSNIVKKKCIPRSTRRCFNWSVGRCWKLSVPIRYNQDNQRDFEETAAAQMTVLLVKRMFTDYDILSKSRSKQQNLYWKNKQPNGGTYVKLEADFRDHWAFSYKNKNSTNGRSSIRIKSNKTM